MERQVNTTISPVKTFESVVYRYPALASGICWILIPLVFGIFVGRSLEEIDRRPNYTGIEFVLVILVAVIAWLNCSTLWPAIQQIPD